MKYKAPGFEIFEKSNENVLLTHVFVIFFACVLLKGIFLKNMKLFRQAIFRGVVRFVKSSLRVDIGLMGQLVYFPLLHIRYPVKLCHSPYQPFEIEL